MSRVEKPIVLLADDNEATRTLITALLHREFNIDTASDGQEAVECLRTRTYAAILLDLRMPLTDGFTVLDFLKEQQAQMLARVLVVTAAPTARELDRASSYNIHGIVTKPFDVETLLEAVRKCALPDEGGTIVPALCSSGPVILLLADFLRQRLL